MGACLSDSTDVEGEVNLYHFHLHRAVGKGAFGKVRVIEHKSNKTLYALKYINKAEFCKRKAIANIIQERRLLEEIDHPFVVNMRYAFQDDIHCYFVLDLMLGGDLRFHLERLGPLPENTVQFWMAELSQALEYLHRQRIMHRDIKPDNILLDEAGHVHITDFNVAIHYSTTRMHSSVAGSMAYIAPEVLGRTGYTWCADWWSLGIVAYELLFHCRPFDGRTSEQMALAITSTPVKFPRLKDGDIGISYKRTGTHRCSREGASAVRQFLERDTSMRLGCRPQGQGIQDIHQHPWFSSIDWEQLDAKALTPPFVPDTKKVNFDMTHELNEFLMAEKPLTHTKRKENVDPAQLSPELRQLEEQFTVYDFTSSPRMSYYPHNAPIVSARERWADPDATPSGTTFASVNPGTLVPAATLGNRSQAGTLVPSPLDSQLQRMPPPLPTLPAAVAA